MVISVEHSGKDLRFFGNPIKMSATPITEYQKPARLGADNEEVLGEYLGFSAEDVKKLNEEGVL
jgi:crotonobetainyl-CoA:carnitine CoA-transferase CaiB-like acyl-CoA transferase